MAQTVIEYDGGRAVAWLRASDTVTETAYAVKSPLTGAWLAGGVVLAPSGVTSWSRRVDRLRDARRMAVPGNGRRYGGHASVSAVLPVPTDVVLALATQ